VRGDSIFPVLNMLNTKYAIIALQGGETLPVQNPWAQGNAWFVDDVQTVDNADEELAALATANLRTTAVIDRSRFPAAASLSSTGAADGELRLTDYVANALTFEAETAAPRLAVFSDIYYPGWRCTIDGEDTDILRADYVLRAVVIPAGKHQVEFRFDPQSLHTTEAVANTSLVALILLFLALVGYEIYRRRRSAAQ
jgi:hypothetical protein